MVRQRSPGRADGQMRRHRLICPPERRHSSSANSDRCGRGRVRRPRQGRSDPAVALADLTRFGQAPLSPESILALAEYTRIELPHRLARRVRAHSALPYIVNTNPHLAKIHNLYRSSFDKIVSMPAIKSVEDNRRFTEELYNLVSLHSDNIPTLAQGFKESRRFMPDEAITHFLDRAIRSRICACTRPPSS